MLQHPPKKERYWVE